MYWERFAKNKNQHKPDLQKYRLGRLRWYFPQEIHTLPSKYPGYNWFLLHAMTSTQYVPIIGILKFMEYVYQRGKHKDKIPRK